MLAPLPPHTEQRIAALRSYAIIDTPREADYDDIVKLASAICDAPISLISFVENHRQWFKAAVGVPIEETPLEQSVCSHAILGDDMMIVRDTRLDPRTADNPLTTQGFGDGTNMRFYAGAVLRTPDGLPLGTLCVLDTKPRDLTPMQADALRVLGRHVMKHLDLRLALRREAESRQALEEALEAQRVLTREIDHRVKNSLAMVAAMLRLQKQRASGEVREALDEAATRISAVASLHQELCESGSFEDVDFAAFGGRIAALLRSSLPPHVEIDVAIEPVRLPYAKASAAAAVINEFATNSVKHAFAGGQPGRVSIRGRRMQDGRFRLDLADDGKGFDAAAAKPAGSGLGRRLMDAAIAQLGARKENPEPGGGARLALSFEVEASDAAA